MDILKHAWDNHFNKNNNHIIIYSKHFSDVIKQISHADL